MLQLHDSWTGCRILCQCLQRHDCTSHACTGGVQLRITLGQAAGTVGMHAASLLHRSFVLRCLMHVTAAARRLASSLGALLAAAAVTAA